MRFALLLVVVACGPKHGAPKPDPAESAFTPAARYAALFEAGRQWRYEVRTETEYVSEATDTGDISWEPLRLVDRQLVICTVTSAEAEAGRATGRITCEVDGEAPREPHPVAGTWTADDQGLSWNGALVMSADGPSSCIEAHAQQLCFADGAVVSGWFNRGAASSSFERVAD